MLNLLFLLCLLLEEISVIFSDLMLPNEMSGYTEGIYTFIVSMLLLFLSYKPVKVYRNNMDHPVQCTYIELIIF